MDWYGNQVLERKKNDEKQMESAVDMTASRLESTDLLLLQLHGCICIYMIPQNADMCWDFGIYLQILAHIMYVPCVIVCAGASMFMILGDLTATDCCSACALHKMQL